MAIRGRQPGCTKPAGSGRKPGQVAKTRTEITDAMRQDVWSSYRKLGGVKWLVEFAKTEPGVFVREVLARIMPPVPREDPLQLQVNTQINQLSDHEVAARIAFTLAKAAHEQGIDAPPPTRTIEAVPEPAPPVDGIPTLPPSSESLPDNNVPLDCYPGTRYEQGLEPLPRRTRTKKDLLG